MKDVLHQLITDNLNTIPCLDHGFVKLIDCMPRLVPENDTADSAVVQMARVSYGEGTKTPNDDRSLLRYLMRNKHTSPFEGIEFKFHIKCPLFIQSQWIRHRTANINQISARYSVVKDEYYIPDANNVRVQSQSNKQSSDTGTPRKFSDFFLSTLDKTTMENYEVYQSYLKYNIGREQARMILPQNMYTEMYWKIDLHNLLHFLALRADSHAQEEIQQYANAIITLLNEIVPETMLAWNEYHPMRDGMILSATEVSLIKEAINDKSIKTPEGISNAREYNEWKRKARLLGFD